MTILYNDPNPVWPGPGCEVSVKKVPTPSDLPERACASNWSGTLNCKKWRYDAWWRYLALWVAVAAV